MTISIDLLAEYIARGHAFGKHVEGNDPNRQLAGKNGFTTPMTGRNLHIETADDLQDYIKRMIDSPDTRGFLAQNGSLHLYNSRDNTYMIMNSSRSETDLGTIYRYPDSQQKFNTTFQLEKKTQGHTFIEVDNAFTPGSARIQVENFAKSVPNHHPALQHNPGDLAAIEYPGTKSHLTGNSPGYQAFAVTEAQLDYVRASGVAKGKGYVATHSDKGLPSKMFFMDEATNRITEIEGRKLTVHTFDNLPEGERVAAARQFFELHRPPGAAISDDGYSGLLKTFQRESGGKPMAAEGSLNNQIRETISINGEKPPMSVPYQSSADVARAAQEGVRSYIGFSAVQADLFNQLPAGQLSAESLAAIKDPKVIGAIKDLAAAKELTMAAEGADKVSGLKMFADAVEGLDGATVKGVVTALETLNTSHLDDAARIAKGLEAASDLAEIAKGLKAARVGLNMSKAGIITTVVSTGAAIALTAQANAMTLDLADQLHTSGRLTPEAHTEYKKMMDEVGTMLTAQAADPFVTAIPGTVIVERIAYNRFKEFSDKHQLPQDVHEMLSPSIVAGSSIRGEIGDNTYRSIPDNPAQVPAVLRDLVTAKQHVVAEQNNYWQTYHDNQPSPLMRALLSMGPPSFSSPAHDITVATPAVQEADKKVEAAKRDFQTEFDRVLADPAGAKVLAGLMTSEQLLEVVRSTAKFSDDPNMDPLIKKFVQTQSADAAWYDVPGGLQNVWNRGAAEDALRKHPEVMKEYLSGLFTPKTEPAVPAIKTPEIPSNPRKPDMFEEDPNFVMFALVFERMKSGETLDSNETAGIHAALAKLEETGQQQVVEEIMQRYPEQLAQIGTPNNAAVQSVVFVPNQSTPAGYRQAVQP